MRKLFILLVAALIFNSCGELKKSELAELGSILSLEGIYKKDNGILIKGKTVLPDSTRLIVQSIRGENVSSQDSNIFVKDGKYEALLIDDSITINGVFVVTCIQNKTFQKKDVFKKIRSIDSIPWTNHSTGKILTFRHIGMPELQYKEVWENEIIGYPVIAVSHIKASYPNSEVKKMLRDSRNKENYEPIGTMNEELRDSLIGNVVKISTDVTYTTKPNNDILEKDIKHFQFKIKEEYVRAKVIALQCVVEGESKPFQSRVMLFQD